MAGLVPAIHGCCCGEDVDTRDKPGHDGVRGGTACHKVVIPEWPSGHIRDRAKVECPFLRAIPALRFASAGMTTLGMDLPFRVGCRAPYFPHPRA